MKTSDVRTDYFLDKLEKKICAFYRKDLVKRVTLKYNYLAFVYKFPSLKSVHSFNFLNGTLHLLEHYSTLTVNLTDEKQLYFARVTNIINNT